MLHASCDSGCENKQIQAILGVCKNLGQGSVFPEKIFCVSDCTVCMIQSYPKTVVVCLLTYKRGKRITFPVMYSATAVL